MDAIKQSKSIATVSMICGLILSANVGGAAFASPISQLDPYATPAPSAKTRVIAPEAETVEASTTYVTIPTDGGADFTKNLKTKPAKIAKVKAPKEVKEPSEAPAPKEDKIAKSLKLKDEEIKQKVAKAPKAPKEAKAPKVAKAEKELKPAKETKVAREAKEIEATQVSADTKNKKAEKTAKADTSNGLMDGTKAANEKLVNGTKKMGEGIASGARASGEFFMKGAKAFGGGMKSTSDKVADMPKMIKKPGKEKVEPKVAKLDAEQKQSNEKKKAKELLAHAKTPKQPAFDKHAQNKSKETLSATELNQAASSEKAEKISSLSESSVAENKVAESAKAKNKVDKNGMGIMEKTLSIMPKMPKLPFMGGKKAPADTKGVESQTASTQSTISQ